MGMSSKCISFDFDRDELHMNEGEWKILKIVSSVLPNEDIQIEMRNAFPEEDFHFFRRMDEAQAELVDAEIFITYGNDLTTEHINNAKQLKWIMVMSAGVEEMPMETCSKNNIIVTNARGIHKIPMAEFTIGMLLQYEKNMQSLWENEKLAKWNRKLPFGEICGKTMLVLGTGAIGSEIARLGKAFQMETIGVNRSGKQVEFIDTMYNMANFISILPQADYIISILPSTKETKNIFTEAHFKQMKKTAVFCNIGRGDVVDEKVLLNALEERQIAHAFLDVFIEEPLPEAHPFWELDNVTVTPHVSSISEKYLPRAFFIFKQNLNAYINDKTQLLNVIDFSKGY